MRIVLIAAATIVLAWRTWCAFTFKVNSDEPQHLHVVWAWTQGLVPYRDLFDNHTPLFHMLYAPLLALFPERADIVEWMRLGMLPLYAGMLALTWWIGRRLWTPRVAWLGTALTALFPTFFTTTLQFRTDNLWALAWLATVAVAVAGPPTPARLALAGVLVGATLAVSLKTTLLIATAAIALVIVAAITRLQDGPGAIRIAWRGIAAFALGMLIVPGMLAAFFAAEGAWHGMVYALFEHNVVAGLGRWSDGALRFVLAPLTLPPALWLAWRARRGGAKPWVPRAFVLLAAFGYLAALYGYWPLFTRQDLLPVLPFVALGAAAALERWRDTHAAIVRVVVVVVLVASVASIVVDTKPWHDAAATQRERRADVLALTTPADLVMDAKGESVFRRRPVYWVLEGITLARMRDGSIVDDIAANLVATRTPVVVADRLPDDARAFVVRNYLRIAPTVYVAGHEFAAHDAGEALEVAVEIEGDYSVVGPHGIVEATLDGEPVAGSRRLERGTHVLRAATADRFALVWTPALQRGLTVARLFGPTLPDDVPTP